ncbi:MAG: hypothetical protein OXE94_11590 [Aestuariivita sp.]|nr:hypothetical protein [Aestuariivita sp.]MCY4202911.1 hypothetical protein [Aestuariivita sp.]MCY4289732.1 hypothetical protein [Aestuariivita sp.]MCY4345176.1 hypothetical protein [Aestuariivita sp.]
MSETGVSEKVPVEQIELDRLNPRIRKFLEMYDGDPTPQQIFLALGAGNDEESEAPTGPTFQKLKQSIITHRGIIHPIILNRQSDGTLVCIEGNTRLALYKDFLKRGVDGEWEFIPALVHEDLEDTEVHAIRLQAHLVGPRPWDPYSKAKYLHELRHTNDMPFAMIVDFCGGRQSEVMTFIEAYIDMENHYRPLISEDGAFDPKRFSGFVELQKPGIKKVIAETGHSLTDFATWVHEDKLKPLNTVRLLPRILKNKKARDVFYKKGARAAEMALDKPKIDHNLQAAPLDQLARALTNKLDALPYDEFKDLRSNPGSDTIGALLEVKERVTEFLREFG